MRSSARFSVLVLSALAAACGGGGDSSNGVTNPGGGGGGGGNPPTPVVTNAVAVSDNNFTPSSIQVVPGATVTWTWASDAREHNVTFPDGTGSGNLVAGATFSRAFPTAGTFTYQCTIHVGMAGTITVK